MVSRQQLVKRCNYSAELHDFSFINGRAWQTANRIIRVVDTPYLAEKEFEVFVTVDRNLSFQQNLLSRKIAVVVLRARTNRLQDLRPLVAQVITSLGTANHGEVITIDGKK